MIESMATGTPVLSGTWLVPEIIAHGRTGFVCSLEKMIEAIPATIKLDRQTCRDYVLSRFSVQSMTDEYEKVSRCSNLMAANTK